MAKSPKDNVVKLKVIPRDKMHLQDLVDFHFSQLRDLVGEYCGSNDGEPLGDLLDQCYYRLHEANDWWDRWKNT